MIQFTKGNLLESDADAIVNAVNTVGVMGKGIALQFKQAYPQNFKQYKSQCEAKALKPGILFVVHDHNSQTGDKIIINFPTKIHWKSPSKLEYVEDGLKELARVIQAMKLKTIAIPALGCGNGGLEWREVKELIQFYLGSIDADIFVYEPI